jgi:ribosomal protein S18 acetylase RimI-like enzyme
MTSDPVTTLSFTLREHVTPYDRNKIFNLLNRGGFFYPHEMAYGMGLFDEHLLRGENSSYQFMLYEAEDRILACGCFGLLPLTDRRYHVHWLAVAADHHGQGIGGKLEAAIVARIRTQGGARIYAEISNRPYHARARAFYERCGYRPQIVIPGYYGLGDDKLLYVKDI